LLGLGQSFGALLLYPIESLDVVDISSEIVDLSLRSFAPYQHRLGQDSRVKVHLDDGRHFVDRAPDGSYDVISMEPPPPTAEGVASLYSVEFYREARRILREGGVFMQWLPLYRVTPRDACGIIRTQADVFPETFVVKVFGDDFMVVSYLAKPKIPLDAIRERVKVFRTERLLEGQRWSPYSKHDIASFEGVLALLLMGPEDVRRLDAPSPYDDDRQILSYTSGDRRLLRRYEGPALSRLSFAALELSRVEDLKDYFDPPLSAEVAAEVTVERAAVALRFRAPRSQGARRGAGGNASVVGSSRSGAARAQPRRRVRREPREEESFRVPGRGMRRGTSGARSGHPRSPGCGAKDRAQPPRGVRGRSGPGDCRAGSAVRKAADHPPPCAKSWRRSASASAPAGRPTGSSEPRSGRAPSRLA
jgi:SAM-dependent methyltransferase